MKTDYSILPKEVEKRMPGLQKEVLQEKERKKKKKGK